MLTLYVWSLLHMFSPNGEKGGNGGDRGITRKTGFFCQSECCAQKQNSLCFSGHKVIGQAQKKDNS
jgi:hypothetical protein